MIVTIRQLFRKEISLPQILGENWKNIIFWVFTLAVGIINLECVHTENYFIKLAIRIPQILIVAYVYKHFVRKEVMTTSLTKFKLKGFWHYSIWLIGAIEFTLMKRASYIMHFKSKDPSATLSDMQHSIATYGTQALIVLVISFILALPMIYAILQTLFLFRIIPVWTYNNRRRLYEISLLTEEILGIALITILR